MVFDDLPIRIWWCLFAPGLKHFDEILQEADGVTLSRGNLGIDPPPDKVWSTT